VVNHNLINQGINVISNLVTSVQGLNITCSGPEKSDGYVTVLFNHATARNRYESQYHFRLTTIDETSELGNISASIQQIAAAAIQHFTNHFCQQRLELSIEKVFLNQLEIYPNFNKICTDYWFYEIISIDLLQHFQPWVKRRCTAIYNCSDALLFHSSHGSEIVRAGNVIIRTPQGVYYVTDKEGLKALHEKLNEQQETIGKDWYYDFPGNLPLKLLEQSIPVPSVQYPDIAIMGAFEHTVFKPGMWALYVPGVDKYDILTDEDYHRSKQQELP
jgi:hypothetical protein